tara:strand:+ start:684 stop:881 length:198 start_codon:yes stop_codon:yes gene_type:complete
MGGSWPVQVLYKNKTKPPKIINAHLFAGLFSFILRKAMWRGKEMVVGVGFEPTNAEAGGFTVRIL